MGLARLFMSHPPLDARIAALRAASTRSEDRLAEPLADRLNENASARTPCSREPPDLAPYLTDHRGPLSRSRGCGRSAARIGQISTLLSRGATRSGSASSHKAATPATAVEQRRTSPASEIVLGLARLSRIRNVDALNYSLIAESGCVLANVQQGRRGSRAFFSFESRLPGQLPDRRQPLDQRRRHQRSALRHDA